MRYAALVVGSGAPVDVFISYASPDEAHRDELEKHLAVLQRAGVVRAWHKGRVAPGQALRTEISAQLTSAHVILLLISADFLASEDCWETDVRHALERQRAGDALVIPILLRPCAWEATPLGALQVLPKGQRPITKWADRDEAWHSVTRAIGTAIEVLVSGDAGAPVRACSATVKEPQRSPAASLRRREPLYFHPLPCEPDFLQREQELNWLEEIIGRERSSVAALVGIGGIGKSVLLQELLRRINGDDRARPDTIFTWSFFIDRDADQLFKELHRYLTGEESPGTSSLGRVYAVAKALRRAGRAVLVLDGMERIQGDDPRSFGRIADPSLRLLLEIIAQGCGRAIALITSRFPLPDLSPFRRAGYEELALSQLTPEVAARLLEARGVRGSLEERKALAVRVGCHALTVSLLGAALADLFDGSAARAPELLNLARLESLDQGGKLARLLDDYVSRLGPEAIGLLERMSAFIGAVGPSLLEDVFLGSGKEGVAGPLANVDVMALRILLARLEKLRLIERVRDQPAEGGGVAHGGEARDTGEPTFVPHAAIKDHFYRRLLGERASSIHAAISASIARAPMKLRPETEEELDRIEELIHHTTRAGQTNEAFRIYMERLGCYEYLGEELGAYARGERIIRGFLVDGDVSRPIAGISPSWVAADLGLFLSKLGDLSSAAFCHEVSCLAGGGRMALHNLFKVRLLQGRLPEAKRIIAEDPERGWRKFQPDSPPVLPKRNVAYHAAVCGLLGEIQLARASFGQALELRGSYFLQGLDGVHHADFLLRTGDVVSAERSLEDNLVYCERKRSRDTATRCRLALAEVSRLRGDPAGAGGYLTAGRDFAVRSGWQEAIAMSHLTAGRLAWDTGDLNGCHAETADGLRIAERWGFGLLRVDLLVLRAELELLCGEAGAEATAREALRLASDPLCSYAWGQSDSADVLGRILSAVGRADEARQALEQACARREALGDPRWNITRDALHALSRHARS